MKLRVLNKALAKKLSYSAYSCPPKPGATIRISGIEITNFDFLQGNDKLVDLRDDIHDIINTAVGLKKK